MNPPAKGAQHDTEYSQTGSVMDAGLVLRPCRIHGCAFRLWRKGEPTPGSDPFLQQFTPREHSALSTGQIIRLRRRFPRCRIRLLGIHLLGLQPVWSSSSQKILRPIQHRNKDIPERNPGRRPSLLRGIAKGSFTRGHIFGLRDLHPLPPSGSNRERRLFQRSILATALPGSTPRAAVTLTPNRDIGSTLHYHIGISYERPSTGAHLMCASKRTVMPFIPLDHYTPHCK